MLPNKNYEDKEFEVIIVGAGAGELELLKFYTVNVII